MSGVELPTVITAIANAQTEGFVAGSLFAQGWSVIFRALDFDSLEKYMRSSPEMARGALLIFSPDLAGISGENINLLRMNVKEMIGFSDDVTSDIHFGQLYPIPVTATDLVSIVRGFLRSPLIRRDSHSPHPGRQAQVLAIGSAGSSTGCTTLAINVAMELSLLDRSTLLIDANFRAPSIAALLAVRNVKSETGWRSIAPKLSISEIGQDDIQAVDGFLEEATNSFDCVVIDLGSISGLSNRLTDRRWTSIMTTWSCDQGDELMVVARPDLLGVHRLEQVSSLIEKTSIRSSLSFTLNMRSQGRKGEAEEAKFLAITTPLRPINLRVIARDSRATSAAESAKSTLVEASERSGLRKSIAKIASQMQR